MKLPLYRLCLHQYQLMYIRFTYINTSTYCGTFALLALLLKILFLHLHELQRQLLLFFYFSNTWWYTYHYFWWKYKFPTNFTYKILKHFFSNWIIRYNVNALWSKLQLYFQEFYLTFFLLLVLLLTLHLYFYL